MKTERNQRGFTLIEVMIALTVFVAIAATMSETASQSVGSLLHLQDKTLASFVADNRMVELRLNGLPPVGENNDQVDMADREWKVFTKVEKTEFPDTHRVTVSVADMQHKDSNLITLVSIMSKY
ncbi:type II secretion system minor pseudopilin GspI [Thalassolituus alkanivorans]|uniref:type II secretion system minor pseudopilin GspI n=1 Tax=Thalassolituus alkanivorans TaxID=2881055 RepID=UPI000C379C28|nr:type II secretion system minor pseudopilin GspI [Thalassolituus alkanivorans]MAY15777.1 type II secretion system protein GspI [Oceanospirillaceae bacterium]MCB2387836.1 type II secretion system minor pseudopilin GspI [Thalassolituus alkanivorans]MCB2422362.1 type II secretion system minor pseudopilin GspI [Thalassolituus alkanivorans]|tara:strand:- start:134 stop:505 length:372 start_codon:yes stop_codon:yes gene_type:complete